MFEHKVKAGETVIRQGDDGDYFYVVEEGVYHALINCDDGSMKKVTNIENVKCGSYPTQVTLPWLFVISNKKMQTILKEKEYYIFWTMNKWLLELKPRKNITYDGKHWKRECWKYCWRRLVQVFEYNGEGNFGELALLYNMPRAATVQVQYHLHSCSLSCNCFSHFFMSAWCQLPPLHFDYVTGPWQKHYWKEWLSIYMQCPFIICKPQNNCTEQIESL